MLEPSLDLQMDSSSKILLDLVRGIVDDLDLETVLVRVLEASRALTGARYAALGVLDARSEQLERFITVGIDEHSRRAIGPLPTGRGVLGELIKHPVPLRTANVGSHPHSYGFPVNHPPMRTFLGVPILIDGDPYGNLYLTEKAGGVEFTDDDEDAVMALARYAAVAIVHARSYAGVEEERTSLVQTVEALRATTDITRAVAGEDRLETILEMIAKRGRALVGASTLLIELIERNELVVAAAAGEVGDQVLGERVPVEGTVAETAMRTRETQWLSDQLTLTRFTERGAGQLGLHPADGLIVPMTFRGEARGALVALDREDGLAFTSTDQRLLEAFADSAAMAVGTAQSAAVERRRQSLAATEAERARWARELHDETLQALAGLRIGLGAARRVEDQARLEHAVDDAVGELQITIDNLRAIIADVRPGSLDELGVQPALEDLVGRIERRGLRVDMVVDLDYEQKRWPTRLVPELETAIYRTIQEALNNVLKHSGSDHAAVRLTESRGLVRITVDDEGRGLDETAVKEGFGVTGMRERASLLGGSLKITSRPGTGVSVTAEFPVQRRSPAQEPSALST
jgi:signal transduction histidine kinase